MKKIISKLFLFGAVVALASCDLERLPESEAAADTFYSNDEEVEYGVIGAYNALMEVYEELWVFSELRSDNVITYDGDSTIELPQQLGRFDTYQFYDYETSPGDYMATIYRAINRANVVLENIDNVVDADLKTQLEAEARFIRGLMYFDLVRIFGDVWYVDCSLTSDEALDMGLSTVDYIYGKIEEDLKYAVSNLPTPSEQSSDDAGRATTYSARGILAKVQLTLGNYSEVKTLLSPIIADLGTTDLEPYYDIFDIYNEMNKEILFAVRYVSGGFGLGSPFMNDNGPYGAGTEVGIDGGVLSYNYPSDKLARAYGIDFYWVRVDGVDEYRVTEYNSAYLADRIAEYSFEEMGTPYGSDAEYWAWSNVQDVRATRNIAYEESVRRFWCKKYWNYGAITILDDGDHDFPVLRYADVLLMYAEALNRTGSTADAVQYVNAIRTRAGLDNLEASEYASEDALHTAILRERQLELAFEGQRFFDMQREGNDYIEDVMMDQFLNDEFYWSYTERAPSRTSFDQSKTMLPIPNSLLILYDDL